MQLEQVDTINLQPLERVFTSLHQVQTGVAAIIWARTGRVVGFGRHQYLVARMPISSRTGRRM